jgi:hypothetical protein
MTETFVLQQTDVPIVTSETSKLTRWAATPSNVSRAFWPGDVVVTETGAPPIAIVPTVSAGTSWRASVALPMLVLCGSTTML